MTVSNGFVDGLCEIMPVKSMKFWKRSLSALYVHITTVWITGYHKVKNRLREAEYMPTSRQQCWDASPMTVLRLKTGHLRRPRFMINGTFNCFFLY